MVEPDFVEVDCAPSKDASDWNDLVRVAGMKCARAQIAQRLACHSPREA
jgi:hypothetical protein